MLTREQDRRVVRELRRDMALGAETLESLAGQYAATGWQLFEVRVPEDEARAAVGREFRRELGREV